MDKKGRTDEEPQKADGENEAAGVERRCVLRIAGSDEFQQCFAVAQLAVKLCEFKKAQSRMVDEIVNLDPKDCLAEAWELIESAREHVLRPTLEDVVERKLRESLIPFKKLCDPKRNKGDSETIHGVIWKVLTTERGFDDLFWTYWRKTSILRLRMIMSRSEVLGNETDKWKEYGDALLASWKRDGVPPNDFLALATFRGERDNRAANLIKKPKGKLKRAAVNGRSVQRTRRAH